MKIKVCAIQDTPVFFNKKLTLEKVGKLVKRYAGEGCRLILFPESFIPGYPRGLSFGSVIGSRSDEGRELYNIYYRESLDSSGPDIEFLENVAKENNCYLIIGATERTGINSSLYCSMLYFSPLTGHMGTHRKIKPTGSERVIWAESDGCDLVTFDTEIGRMGGLICWENYMPLARMAMFNRNIQLYLAPTADCRDEWVASMIHIAVEGRCFVISANQFQDGTPYPEFVSNLNRGSATGECRGGSLIVSPMGKILAGPLYNKSGALVVDIDTDDCTRGKMDLDLGGHYSRPDIFKFEVANQPATVKENKTGTNINYYDKNDGT